MALFELGEKIKPREAMQALDAEVAALKAKIDAREKTIEEMSAMVVETKQAEEKFTTNQAELFQLLCQKIRSTEAQSVDDYCSFMEAEIEVLEARTKKGGGAKPGAAT